MLVLHRRVGDKITIGPDVTVTVIATTRGTCKLGIDAPKELRVNRVNRENEKRANDGEKVSH